MRRIAFVLMVAFAAGCGKKSAPTVLPPPPSDAAFDEDSSENTLAWLVAQRNALDVAGGPDGAEKFKALAESMKGRSIVWPGKLAASNANKTYVLTARTLHTNAPESGSSDVRKRHYALVCKPVEPGVPLRDTDPFVSQPELGFPSGAGDWHRNARPGLPVRLTGTIALVQVQQNSWTTGYGIQDRVVHTEIGITLHIAGGTVAPAP
jgi:hypothetical protein